MFSQNFNTLTAAKHEARIRARAALSQITPKEYTRIGAVMAQHLFELPEWRQADCIFCFVSLAQEPDTMPVLRRAMADGKPLYVPRMHGGGQMEAAALQSLTALVPNRLGVLEPPKGPGLSAVDFSTRSLAVVPCLAAGRDGNRLGRGGGYYDRFLADFPGHSVLLCAERLLLRSLPAGPLDFRPDLILTENGPV